MAKRRNRKGRAREGMLIRMVRKVRVGEKI